MVDVLSDVNADRNRVGGLLLLNPLGSMMDGPLPVSCVQGVLRVKGGQIVFGDGRQLW